MAKVLSAGMAGPQVLTPGAELGSREDWRHPCLRSTCEISHLPSGLSRWALGLWESVDNWGEHGHILRQRGAEDRGLPDNQFSQQSTGPPRDHPSVPQGCSHPHAPVSWPATLPAQSPPLPRSPPHRTEAGPSWGLCVHFLNP